MILAMARKHYTDEFRRQAVDLYESTPGFVADHRDTFEVKRLCEVIEVDRSSFYAWDAAAPTRARRASADEELAERIRVVHHQDGA